MMDDGGLKHSIGPSLFAKDCLVYFYIFNGMNHGDDDEPVEMRAKVIQDELPPPLEILNCQRGTHRVEEEDDDFCVCLCPTVPFVWMKKL